MKSASSFSLEYILLKIKHPFITIFHIERSDNSFIFQHPELKRLPGHDCICIKDVSGQSYVLTITHKPIGIVDCGNISPTSRMKMVSGTHDNLLVIPENSLIAKYIKIKPPKIVQSADFKEIACNIHTNQARRFNFFSPDEYSKSFEPVSKFSDMSIIREKLLNAVPDCSYEVEESYITFLNIISEN